MQISSYKARIQETTTLQHQTSCFDSITGHVAGSVGGWNVVIKRLNDPQHEHLMALAARQDRQDLYASL